MRILNHNISSIIQNNYDYFINLENVKGVGFGYKHINGIQTNELCLQVLVKNKVNKSYITSNNIIPKSYMGIKTDVIKIGSPKLLGGDIAIPNKYRPLEGGCGIYSEDAKLSGTLGCIVVKKGIFGKKYFILSNNHVLADNNSIPIGTKVIQPPKSTGGSFPTDVVAKLSSFVPLKFSFGIFKAKNIVDCAIAEITNKSIITNKIIDIGEITGTSNAKLNDNVKKTGFISGLTTGKVISLDASVEVDSDLGVATFENQIITSQHHMHGDSGSAVLNDKNEIIGLLFGGDSSTALVNDINVVFKKLKVEIYK